MRTRTVIVLGLAVGASALIGRAVFEAFSKNRRRRRRLGRLVGRSPINDLPDAVILRIFQALGAEECHERARVWAVCRRWRKLIGAVEWELLELGASPAASKGSPASARTLECVWNSVQPNLTLPPGLAHRVLSVRSLTAVAITGDEAGVGAGPYDVVRRNRALLQTLALVVLHAPKLAAARVGCRGWAHGARDESFLEEALGVLGKARLASLRLEWTQLLARHSGPPREARARPWTLALRPFAPTLRTLAVSPDLAIGAEQELAELAAAAPGLTALELAVSSASLAGLGHLGALPRLASLEVLGEEEAGEEEAAAALGRGVQDRQLAQDLASAPESVAALRGADWSHLSDGLEAIANGRRSAAQASLRRLALPDGLPLDARGARALAPVPLASLSLAVSAKQAIAALEAGALPRLAELRLCFRPQQGAAGTLLAAAAGAVRRAAGLRAVELELHGPLDEGEAELELVAAAGPRLRSFRGPLLTPALAEALAACPGLRRLRLTTAFGYGLADPAVVRLFCERRPAGAAPVHVHIGVAPEIADAAAALAPLLRGRGRLELSYPLGRPHKCGPDCGEEVTPAWLYHRLRPCAGRVSGRQYFVLNPFVTRTPEKEIAVGEGDLAAYRSARGWHVNAAHGRLRELPWIHAAASEAAGLRGPHARLVRWLAETDPPPPPQRPAL